MLIAVAIIVGVYLTMGVGFYGAWVVIALPSLESEGERLSLADHLRVVIFWLLMMFVARDDPEFGPHAN